MQQQGIGAAGRGQRDALLPGPGCGEAALPQPAASAAQLLPSKVKTPGPLETSGNVAFIQQVKGVRDYLNQGIVE